MHVYLMFLQCTNRVHCTILCQIRAMQLNQWLRSQALHLNLLRFPTSMAFCLTSLLARANWTKIVQALKDLSFSFTSTAFCTMAILALTSFLSFTNCFQAIQYLENNWYLENRRLKWTTHTPSTNIQGKMYQVHECKCLSLSNTTVIRI